MNILFINGSADLYGANRILAEVIMFLSERHKVFLILPQEGEFTDFLKDHNINVEILYVPDLPNIGRGMSSIKGICQTGKRFLKSYTILKKITRQHNIDWAYVNTLSCVLSLKLFNWLKVPAIVHVHEILVEPKTLTHFINVSALKWAQQVICVSRPVTDNLRNATTNVLLQRKITTILNGIGDRFHLTKEAILNAPQGEKVQVTLIGRIKPEKGMWFFLSAIEQLPAQVAENAIFNIVGGPAPNGDYYVDKLKSDIQHNKYRNNIRYTGFTKDVSGLQLDADILVIPSLMKDPFPTTVLEALSAGKPVIATNTGGAVQSVVHGETGFLIDGGDVEQFGKYLELLIGDKTLRREMGTKARAFFDDHFRLEVFRKNILAWFEEKTAP